ncbi:MAG: DUF420 domain-containing protein [Bacteroidia bacterium]|nr:DUF420 domain-containing protein [Bacteroidia bacterium]
MSIVVFSLIIAMQFMPDKTLGDFSVSSLPVVNAIINSLVSILLIVGLRAIKKGNVKLHNTIMRSAFILSALFIITYVIYHTQAAEAKYGDINGDGLVSQQEIVSVGMIRSVYFFILASHIILSAVILPMVLITMYFALTKQFDRHRKIAKITWPLWLYVSITGVIVYFMIAPYYH